MGTNKQLAKKQLDLILKSVWESTSVYQLKDTEKIYTALMTSSDEEIRYIEDSGMELIKKKMPIKQFMEGDEEGTRLISDCFWCCNCKDNFLRISVEKQCEVCKTVKKDDPRTIDTIIRHFGWENILSAEEALLDKEMQEEDELYDDDEE